MSDKEQEKTDLEYFIDAHQIATGQRLGLVNPHEKPDFICRRPDGSVIGVELTRVMRGPKEEAWDRIIEKKDEMDPYDALDRLHTTLEKKEYKRNNHYGELADKCILVIQIKECPIRELMPYIVKEDYSFHGFAEIWIADYSTLEAYGVIELFGLSLHNWGYHENPVCGGKPYG